MLSKALRRLERTDPTEALSWSLANSQKVETICRPLDPDLWGETEEWFTGFQPEANRRLAEIGVGLGGGGNSRLLYFLTRSMQPEHVVETGVAAGWSSAAILTAIDRNGHGTLHSSDFPYFRLANPEQYIGVLVPEDLQRHWRLHLQGDRKNLPRILEEAGRIGLFHYDSDKSEAGRRFAMDLVMPRLDHNGVVVMDDIHNNLYFRDLCLNCTGCLVAEGHIGILGLSSTLPTDLEVPPGHGATGLTHPSE